jgi:RHS repeat-associated protein
LTDDLTLNINTKSLPLASYVKNIEDDNWTKSYTWYDQKGRAIGSHSINHLGGYTKTESELDFSGTPKMAITRHKRLDSDTERVITENFTYDHQNRLLTHTHQVDNNPVEYLAQNKYNELSQLEYKKVGGTVYGNGLQQVDYLYNIRGWMTQINNPADLSGGDLFGYKIKYNNPIYTSLTTGKFNGNIAEVDWRNSYDGILKRYDYTYDGLNRLKNGLYAEPDAVNPQNGNFNEYLTYNLNGNILSLKRNAPQVFSPTATMVDDLDYQYIGNRLNRVIENALNDTGYEGGNNFIAYDVNGNMTNMLDKGIQRITYNYLNLPDNISINQNSPFGVQISFGLEYLYRADGTKLRKKHSTGGGKGQSTTNNITDYLDGFQYSLSETVAPCEWCRTEVAFEEQAFKKDIIIGPIDPLDPPPLSALWRLDFVPTAEGFYSFAENRYIYQYRDHLGNARLSYAKKIDGSLEVTDKNDYYPFGLNHIGGSKSKLGSYNNYKYNGKELQETGMYDFGARMYMPDIGRWGVVDLLADLAPSLTPYRYGFNNPISFTDPFGLFETRKEAREYRREHDISGSVTKNKDGSFSINDKTNHVSYTKGTEGSGENFANDGVQESALITKEKKQDSNTETNNSQYNLASTSYNPLNVEKNWPHLVGPSLFLAGQDILPKSLLKNIGMRGFVPRGVNANTSVASVVLRNAIPKTWPRLKFLPKATSLGGQLGRAVPIVGAGMTVWDISYNFAPWVSDQIIEALPYSEAQKQDKHPGKWMEDAGVCFIKGTIVIGDQGNVNIEDIQVGDKVYSYNEETKESELSIVERIYKRKTGEIFELAIGKEIIWVTREHPFYVIKKGWTKVGNLKIGDEIKTQYQNVAKVGSYKIHTGEVTVYNIEVSKNHNYYVSDSRILVHNKNIKPEK